MRLRDIARFSWKSLHGHGLRTVLMAVAMAIGVAAVIVLTALGEGAREYVADRFMSLGSNLLIVFPGRSETAGANPGLLLGRTPRDLTLEDALALEHLRGVRRIAPLTIGSAEVSREGRSREVPILGSTSDFIEVRHLELAQGRFLPEADPRTLQPYCVIGSKLRDELFATRPALGEWVRIGDRRFRVIGVFEEQGESLGVNIDEIAVVPVASAQAMFNTPSLLRILVEARSRPEMEAVRDEIRRVLRERHQGEEDVTVVTQDAVLAAFDRILLALTLSVAGIAAISLGVAGILIMNVMLIAVTQRTSEIGLLKAMGAAPAQIRVLFFAEASILSGIGAGAGLLLGELGSLAIRETYPAMPAHSPPWAVAAALASAMLIGIAFSVLPARRAARLDAALALARR